ncbi:MAG: TraR/DksA family transcriptional regulator [Candidatus Aquicultor sp.]
MDEKELKEFRERLLKLKADLEGELKYVDKTWDESQSEWTGENQYDNHMGDLGTATYSREQDLSLGLNTRDLMAKVDEALKRIDEGTYGFCRVCGRPIERERLEALPYADLCIEDKKKEEKSW